MWFSRRRQPPIRSLIGEGTTVRGELRFSDGLRVDGEVWGDIVAEGDVRSILVISENARVCGKVKAAHVIINGVVEGPVQGDELVELQPKARIVGDVRYAALEMHQGALIDGEMRPLKSEERVPLKLAASSRN